MKTQILDINGKAKGTIELPSCFTSEIREDIVQKVVEAKKKQQPYAPSPVAGKQHAAKGKIVHRRHVWRSGYGRGASRVPRKIFSRRGSQFNWEAAEVPQAKGGMRAHPPKVAHMLKIKRINKKELRIALVSAISATAKGDLISKRYERLNNEKISNVPFIVDSKLLTLKTKELLSSLKKILGEKLFDLATQKKKVRAGIGKLRGRKYKKNAGVLLVIGNKEKLKINAFEIVKVKELSVTDLAKGGVGRLTIYTEEAVKELGEKLK